VVRWSRRKSRREQLFARRATARLYTFQTGREKRLGGYFPWVFTRDVAKGHISRGVKMLERLLKRSGRDCGESLSETRVSSKTSFRSSGFASFPGGLRKLNRKSSGLQRGKREPDADQLTRSLS
jgi:hypothetical protein